MKKFLFSLVLLLPLSLFAQKANFYGMVQLKDNLWVDQTEITIGEYTAYLDELKAAGSFDSLLHYPAIDTNSMAFSEYYYYHPAYHDYPVIGLTYEQVRTFCDWRTAFFNENSGEHYRVRFRLPTKNEWEELAVIGLPEVDSLTIAGLGSGVTYRKKRRRDKGHPIVMRMNYNDLKCGLGSLDGYYFTNPVEAYESGFNQLFGVAGNVAEMVAEEGISKGGSYLHDPKFCRVEEEIPYDGAQEWLGFRCVVEIVQTP